METPRRPWERVSEQAAWYDDQPFDIGDRVAIIDPAEQAFAEAASARVVGYDAAGPRKGEDFYRVLVLPDRPNAQIIALPPAALLREEGNERRGMALTTLLNMRQKVGEVNFPKLLAFLTGEACAQLLEDPELSSKRVRIAGMNIPGLLLPELIKQAQLQIDEPPA